LTLEIDLFFCFANSHLQAASETLAHLPMKTAHHAFSMGDLSPARRLGLSTWVTLLCLLAWGFSGLDMGIMQVLADSHGFKLRDQGVGPACVPCLQHHLDGRIGNMQRELSDLVP
jgi:hypothetical protein